MHKLQVSYNGNRIDPERVDWNRVNPLSYTFLQKAGPGNNLGKIKFLYPNRHTVYMHDTLPVRKKYFKTASRMVGHECVRMEKPQAFAEVLLAEDKGWTAAQVKELWDKGNNSAVTHRAVDPGAHGLFHRRRRRQRQGLDVCRCLWPRPQARRGAVRQRQRLSAAAARREQAAAKRDRRIAVHEQQRSRTASGSGIAGSIGGFFED